MAASPIIPTNTADPTGADKKERGAIRAFEAKYREIRRGALDILARQRYEVVTVNSAELNINATRYNFELDQTILQRIGQEIQDMIESILLEGGEQNLWFLKAYVAPAAVQGVAQTHANLSIQSEAYKLSRPNLQSLLNSPVYQKRIGLLRARELEEMKNLTQYTKENLRKSLSEGMSLGKNPRDIAKDITERTNVSLSRAKLIARTEVPGALRRARMDEAEQAQKDLGILTKQMHISTFSPTTRIWHARRHGTLHTISEQREWWSLSKNACNCKCSTIEILVDEAGKPLSESIITRANRNKDAHIEKMLKGRILENDG
ncbi:MAG: phage head morphogenesis protein [Pseudomonas sp.]|nr:phage head morphogenesis protein [Pseudomonas sp.]